MTAMRWTRYSSSTSLRCRATCVRSGICGLVSKHGSAARLARARPFDRAVAAGGAALAAGYALATWLPPNVLTTGPDTGSEAIGAFALVDDLRPALAALPAKTRSVIEADLSGLEQDWQSIEQALAADPDNALLRELRMSAEDRATALVDQVNRLTQFTSTQEIEI